MAGRTPCLFRPERSLLYHPASDSVLGDISAAAQPHCPQNRDTAWVQPERQHLPCAVLGPGHVLVLYAAVRNSHVCYCVLAALRLQERGWELRCGGCGEQGTFPSRSGGSRGSERWLALRLPGLCQPAKPVALRVGPQGPRDSWSRDSGAAGVVLAGEVWRGTGRGLAGAGLMVAVAGNSMVRRGEGSIHLLEGDGTAWGGPNAHHTGFQGGKPSCQQTDAVWGSRKAALGSDRSPSQCCLSPWAWGALHFLAPLRSTGALYGCLHLGKL